MKQDPLINAVDVAAYCVPTDAPEADGTLKWKATEMVLVHVHAGGEIGLGYSYTAGVPAARLIKDKLEPCLIGASAFDLPRLWSRMQRTLRNIGRPGLGMMTIAALDQALWDLKAKLLGISLSALWGQARFSVPLYGSGGFTSYTDGHLQSQLEDWLGQGFGAVKIKLGLGVDDDARRVDAAQAVIGHTVELMVDANGAYDRRTALALIEELHPRGIAWLEEPVSSDDLEGLRWLRDRSPGGLAIAAGEYGWDAIYFRQMLAAGAVDVLQADATRCGFTGFLQAAHLCEAYQVPLSAHCAPAIHASICAAVPRLRHLEYFHDHVRIESLLFSDGPTLSDGELWPNRDKPGHGLKLRTKVAEPYQM